MLQQRLRPEQRQLDRQDGDNPRSSQQNFGPAGRRGG
jgi:hypothetical protein